MFYSALTAVAAVLVEISSDLFAPGKRGSLLVILGTTIWLNFYSFLHYGPFLGKQWIRAMEKFRNRKADVILTQGYQMKHCCSYSLLVAFVRSTIGVLAFQLLKPGTLNGAFLFGLLDFSLRFTQSDVFLWEGKEPALIGIWASCQFVSAMSTAAIFYFFDILGYEPLLLL